ncbi:MAG TPA: hypothetical protein VMN57_11775 [Anaerolineales bacterium]|nr:hypothetical protein [Anaerolineales bacterium]
MTPVDRVTLPGIVERGHGVASGQAEDSPFPHGTIEMQTPFFKELGLDLADFYPGTLNISIAPRTFVLVRPEFTFREVAWTPEIPPEDFSFSRCGLIFDGRRYNALIYTPHPETKIRHFQSPETLEILAPYIEGIRYGDNVQLQLNPDEIRIR